MRFIRTQLMMLAIFREQSSRTSAYLDPGTGSMILQVILGGVAGAAVAVKMFWHRIIAFLPSRSSSSDRDAG
jgi:hypothetical protein